MPGYERIADKEEKAAPHPPQDKDAATRRQLYMACFVCGVFMIVELVGGVVAHSLAIITDAAHLMTDLSAFSLAIVASYIASQRATSNFSYGFKRAEVLSALLSTLMIWVLTAILLWEATSRASDWFRGKAKPVNGKIMFAIAIVGVGVNLILERVLGDTHALVHGHSHGHHDHGHGAVDDHSDGHSHNHHHGHDHSHSHEHGEHSALDVHDPLFLQKAGGSEHCAHSDPELHHAHDSRNENLDAAYLHVIGDLVQSVGVAIAGLIIWWKPHWQIIDPICTFLFGFIVMFTTMKTLWSNIQVLLEGVPEEIDVDDLRSQFENLKDSRGRRMITSVHDLHVWNLSRETIILTSHMNSDYPREALLEAHKLCQKKGINHVTIQMLRTEDGCIAAMCCE